MRCGATKATAKNIFEQATLFKRATFLELLAEPSTSYWLKNAIQDAMNRDCLDAIRDAQLLTDILEDRFNRLPDGK